METSLHFRGKLTKMSLSDLKVLKDELNKRYSGTLFQKQMLKISHMIGAIDREIRGRIDNFIDIA